MEDSSPGSTDSTPGLIAGLATLAKNSLGLMMSRIELAALELGEMREGLLRFALTAALGMLALWFAVACWTVLIIVLAWPAWGWKILLLLAVAFTVLAGAALLLVQAQLRQGRLSMPATMAELRADRDALL